MGKYIIISYQNNSEIISYDLWNLLVDLAIRLKNELFNIRPKT